MKTSNIVTNSIYHKPSSIKPNYIENKIVSIKNVQKKHSNIHRFLIFLGYKKNKTNFIKIDDNQITKRIIGKSINPNVFKSSRVFEEKLIVDGYGKIIGIKKELSISEYNILLKYIIKPLNRSQENLSSVRTPHSAYIDIASLINFSDIKLSEKNSILNKLKFIFLDGSCSRDNLKFIYDELSDKPSFSNIIHHVKEIIDTVPNQVPKTLANDNLYGRLFDSNLAEFILEETDTNQNKNHQYIVDFLIKKLPERGFEHFERIKDMMINDPQPWRVNIPEVYDFFDNPTKNNYISMLKSKNKYSSFLLSSIGVKAMLVYPSLKYECKKATEKYISKIKKQRVLIENKSMQHQENHRSGILLDYQYDGLFENAHGLGLGVRPIDRYISPSTYNEDSIHNINAIKKGRAIGIGMSGSSNLLEPLFQIIMKENKDFQISTARLQAAAFLTFSGGHSFNEAYNIFNSALEPYVPMSYNLFSEISSYHNNAVNHAYNKTLETSNKINWSN
ncbi:TPA: hypothetical protein ACMDOB_001692 [Vibrio metschnikovii]|uniref:hypothetical protein n=1 Tax=Vibrio metschnikovii TaxID=28172 RepID=UPI002FC8295D